MNRPLLSALWLLLAASLVSAGPGHADYPETASVPVPDTLHGTVVVDNYRWLENGTDSLVRGWTDAQNRLARSFLDTLPQRE